MLPVPPRTLAVALLCFIIIIYLSYKLGWTAAGSEPSQHTSVTPTTHVSRVTADDSRWGHGLPQIFDPPSDLRSSSSAPTGSAEELI